MDRRAFLRILGIGGTGLLIPESTRKYFFFGGVKYRVRKGGISTSQIVALEMERIRPRIAELFDRDDLFYAQLKTNSIMEVSSREMRVPLELKNGLIIDIK